MIDLGTQPLGHSLSSAVLDEDRVDFLVDSLNIVELPVVLDVFPRYDAPEERRDALRRGHAGLVADDLIGDDRVHRDLEAWLRVLEQPHWYVSARRIPRPFTEDVPVTRVCLAEGEHGTVVAVRAEGALTVRASAGDSADELLRALGRGEGWQFGSVSAPTDLLSEALDASPTDASATAVRLARLGIDDGVASEVGSAMNTCSGHAEITSVTVESGSRITGEHPVAFFDTHRGRIVATSSTAADGRRWTTLAPGTDARIRSALAELVERAAN